MTPETIEAYGVRLRLFRPADAADTAAGCADPLTQRFLPGLPSPYTEDDARWWITEGRPRPSPAAAPRTPSPTGPPTGCWAPSG